MAEGLDAGPPLRRAIETDQGSRGPRRYRAGEIGSTLGGSGCLCDSLKNSPVLPFEFINKKLTMGISQVSVKLSINFIEMYPVIEQNSASSARGGYLMFAMLCDLLRDERGVTAIEYAVIASFIGVAIASAVSVVGTNLSSTFTTVAGNM
jgi:pilus assembly protein Flp/PilA